MHSGRDGFLHRLAAAADVILVCAREPADRGILDGLGDRPHRLEIAVARRGEARLDHVHAHALELARDAQLLFPAHGRAGALLAIAHRRIEYDQLLFSHDGLRSVMSIAAGRAPRMAMGYVQGEYEGSYPLTPNSPSARSAPELKTR